MQLKYLLSYNPDRFFVFDDVSLVYLPGFLLHASAVSIARADEKMNVS